MSWHKPNAMEQQLFSSRCVSPNKHLLSAIWQVVSAEKTTCQVAYCFSTSAYGASVVLLSMVLLGMACTKQMQHWLSQRK